MSCFMCESCYKISKVKLASCPKCGATESYVLPGELATSRSPLGPARPVGAGTGGIMPKSYEEYLPPLPVLPVETEKESEKKRSKKIRR